MRVAIMSSSKIGKRCEDWVRKHMQKGWKISTPNSADIIVSVFYRNLFKHKFIRTKLLIVNFHGGILPDYRGSATYAWAIINKEKETGVTVHVIDDEKIDNGDIISVEKFRIEKNDTTEDLFNKGEELAFKMFKKNFNKIMNMSFSKIRNVPTAGKLYLRKDFQKAKDLTRYVRAFTYKDKESAFYFNSKGKKIHLKW